MCRTWPYLCLRGSILGGSQRVAMVGGHLRWSAWVLILKHRLGELLGAQGVSLRGAPWRIA